MGREWLLTVCHPQLGIESFHVGPYRHRLVQMLDPVNALDIARDRLVSDDTIERQC